MRILLTNRVLNGRTGTEICTRDFAIGLTARNHAVSVFSPQPGPLAEELRERGIPVVARLQDLPHSPDMIHGHHHTETTLAILHFPGIPAIFVCHDRNAWHDTPPLHPQIRRYVAVDHNCLERLRDEAGLPESSLLVIPNAVDLAGMLPPRVLPTRPRRALVFSNYVGPGKALDAVFAACAKHGVAIDVVGAAMGAQAKDTGRLLSQYDIVFGKARCALEALAAGASVILFDLAGLGGIVHSAKLPEMLRWNLGARCLQGEPTQERIGQELERYSSADAALATAWVRQHCSLDTALDSYTALYERVIAEDSPAKLPSGAGPVIEAMARRVGQLEGQLRLVDPLQFMAPLPQQVSGLLRLRAERPPLSMAGHESRTVVVTLENHSRERLWSGPPYPVLFSYHWRGAEFEGNRTRLTHPILPGAVHQQGVTIVAPARPGSYELELTLVQEGLFWMDAAAEPLVHHVSIVVTESGEETLDLRRAAKWVPFTVERNAPLRELGFVTAAREGMLTFLEDAHYLPALLREQKIGAVLTTPELAASIPGHLGLATSRAPRHDFTKLHNHLAARTNFYGDPIATDVAVGAEVHPQAFVAEFDVRIGPGARVGAHATILEGSVIGAGAVIQAGAVIGACGFQTTRLDGELLEIAHAGTVHIGEGAIVMAHAVVARGVFHTATRIGAQARIGNQAFISHHAHIGRRAFVGHGAVVNGNVAVGDDAWIGPGATLANDIEVGAGARVSLGATVIRTVSEGEHVTGAIAVPHRKALRRAAQPT